MKCSMSGEANAYTKKERLTLQRERDKLDRSLGGIKDMGGLPDMIFVIDTNKEDIAIQEAQRLNIPVAAIVDTNSDPKGITYVVPGNDDAGRAISLYCDLVARAVIDGISRAQGDHGIDVGASAQPVVQEDPGGSAAASASRVWPVRAAPPTTSRSSPACRARSRRSSTTSASSTTGSSPNSITTPRTRSAKKSAFRAAPMAGLPRPRRYRGSGIIANAAWPALPATGFDFPDYDIPCADGGTAQARAALAPDRQEGHSTMATITAAMVKELRESTGAGMMDCKAALTETARRHGGSAGLAAQEGPVQGRQEGRPRCRRRPDRRHDRRAPRASWSRSIPRPISSRATSSSRASSRWSRRSRFDVGADVEKIKAAKVGDVTVETAISDAIATIGENMSLRRAASLEVGQGVVASYIHGAVIDGAGKMGVMVALESTGKTDELAALGRQLAMHVAATNPQALDPAGLDPEVVKREKDVLADKYRQQGKPENVIEKIVESGLKTYYKEVCLLEQAFIHDSGKSVAQAVKEAEGKVGAPVKITGFVRYALGEGIEKQESDFAAEVAAASGKK